MTANEKKVREHYPHAAIDRQKGHDGSVTFFVRQRPGAGGFFAYGDTKAQAWRNAAKSVESLRAELHARLDAAHAD